MTTSMRQLLRGSPVASRFANQLFHTSRLAHQQTNQALRNLKPFDEIPTKKSFLPASLELLLSGGPGYLHEHCDRRHEELGPIYRDHLGKIEIVFLSDTNHIQTVIANEGQYPRHNVPEAWSFYNELHNIERGLFFQMGEPWLRTRKVFNQVMAKPESSSRFVRDLFAINEDLLSDWQTRFTRSRRTDDFTVPDIKAALCNWSIESTGCMLFGSRMGCVPIRGNPSRDGRADELVRHVTNMFEETSNFQLIPVQLAHKLNLGTWKRFERATSGMLRVANLYADEYLNRAKGADGPAEVSILGDIHKMDAVSRDEISCSLVDLIIAAADTTSAALQWMVYLLAKHQDLQARILYEVNEALSSTTTLETFKDRAPLVKAFMRESLRLYPTAPFLARTLNRDIVLDGYAIPAGKLLVFSLFTTSRMQKYFDSPLEFQPDRWLRSSSRESISPGCPHLKTNKHAYASLPFGAGARICVGRRAAELQMVTFLASLVRRFHVELGDKSVDNTRVRLKMILAPAKPISIKLRAR